MQKSILSAIAVLGGLLFLSASVFAEAKPKQSSYHLRIVQTLIETNHGRKARTLEYLAPDQVAKYLTSKTPYRNIFSQEFDGKTKSSHGIYRIIVGTDIWQNLKNQWWKKISSKDHKSGAEVWRRFVTVDKKKYQQVLARRKRGNVILEIRYRSTSLSEAKRFVLGRFPLFWRNAIFFKVFSPEVDAPKLSSALAPAPKAKPFGFEGTWVGSMHNSRGEEASTRVEIVEAPDGKQLIGTWHANWLMINGTRQGHILTWEHLKILSGCRDYKNRMVVSHTGKTASLTYEVTDRCREPNTYSGKALLARKEQ